MVALTDTPFRRDPSLSTVKTGVYAIINRITGKRYIGSAARGFKERWRVHLHDLRHNKHHSRHLQISWNKYGEENFEFVVLARCSPEWCLAMEQIYLNRFRSFEREHGYNLTPTAGSCLGVKHTSEQVAANKARQVGKKMSEGFCLKMAASMKRRMSNPIEREKITAGLALGRAPEAKSKADEGKKRYWENPNPEHVANLRAASHSASANQKRSLKKKGVPHTPEWRANLTAANKKRTGLKMSDVARANMRAGAKKRFERSEERERMKYIGELGRTSRKQAKINSNVQN